MTDITEQHLMDSIKDLMEGGMKRLLVLGVHPEKGPTTMVACGCDEDEMRNFSGNLMTGGIMSKNEWLENSEGVKKDGADYYFAYCACLSDSMDDVEKALSRQISGKRELGTLKDHEMFILECNG